MGRPSIYTAELAAEICRRMESGQTLLEICRDEKLPNRQTVYEWVRSNREGFGDMYARARESLYEHWADEITEIAEDGSNDWMERERKDGSTETVLNREHVERSKLRVDTRKWLLSKLRPGQYGEKSRVDLNVSGTLRADLVAIAEAEAAARGQVEEQSAGVREGSASGDAGTLAGDSA